MATFGYSEEPETPVTETPVQTSRSLGRALKEDSPPFLFAAAVVVGATSLYKRIFGRKGRKGIVRRLVKR